MISLYYFALSMFLLCVCIPSPVALRAMLYVCSVYVTSLCLSPVPPSYCSPHHTAICRLVYTSACPRGVYGFSVRFTHLCLYFLSISVTVYMILNSPPSRRWSLSVLLPVVYVPFRGLHAVALRMPWIALVILPSWCLWLLSDCPSPLYVLLLCLSPSIFSFVALRALLYGAWSSFCLYPVLCLYYVSLSVLHLCVFITVLCLRYLSVSIQRASLLL